MNLCASERGSEQGRMMSYHGRHMVWSRPQDRSQDTQGPSTHSRAIHIREYEYQTSNKIKMESHHIRSKCTVLCCCCMCRYHCMQVSLDTQVHTVGSVESFRFAANRSRAGLHSSTITNRYEINGRIVTNWRRSCGLHCCPSCHVHPW